MLILPRDQLIQNLLASVVVFLVALPLCLGIAIASGLSPMAGLVTAAAGGLFVGAWSGCPLQVSGPAASLIAIVWGIVQTQGIEALGWIVLLSGLIQLGIGYLKIGLWFRAISPAVMQGGLSGLGVLIFSSQFHLMVDDMPRSSGLENLVTLPESLMKLLWPIDGMSHHWAGYIGLLTILSVIVWLSLPKRFHRVPAPLVGVMVAVIAANAMSLPIKFVTLSESLLEAITGLSLAHAHLLLNPNIWLSAVVMTFIACSETILTVLAIDCLTATRPSNLDQEMKAQGVGNVVCGLLGVLPLAGVIVRSAANVDSGATSRLSTQLHGVWMIVIAVVFPFVLELIPSAALAGLLVYTGWRLINYKAVLALKKQGWAEVAIFAMTAGLVILVNLLAGIIIGLVLSVFKLVYQLSFLEIEVVHDQDAQTATLNLEGSATFLSLPKMNAIFETLPSNVNLDIRLDRVQYVDHACLDFFHQWEARLASQKKHLVIHWPE